MLIWLTLPEGTDIPLWNLDSGNATPPLHFCPSYEWDLPAFSKIFIAYSGVKRRNKQRECPMLRNLQLTGLRLKVAAFPPEKAGINTQ